MRLGYVTKLFGSLLPYAIFTSPLNTITLGLLKEVHPNTLATVLNRLKGNKVKSRKHGYKAI